MAKFANYLAFFLSFLVSQSSKAFEIPGYLNEPHISLYPKVGTDQKPPGAPAVPTINIDKGFSINCVTFARKLASLVDAKDNVIGQYTAGYGVKDPVHNTGTVDANTRFCIGSCTKQFTSALVGKLLAQNNVSTMWDTPLSQLIGPVESQFYNFPTLNNQLFTLRDILAHRTGIPRFDLGAFLKPTLPRTAIWKKIHFLTAIQPLAKTWRSSFMYNNWMYTLAGHIAEIWAANGMTWEQLVHSNFFQPLGMTGGVFVQQVTNFSSFAMPGFYNPQTKTWSALDTRLFQILQYQSPAGSICTTANDMAKYLTWLVQQKDRPGVPSKWILRQAQQPSNAIPQAASRGVYAPNFPTDDDTFTYGMGWFQDVYRSYKVIEHSGGIFGYLSYLAYLPDLRLGIFMSSSNNILGGADYPIYLVPGIIDILLNINPNFFNPTTLCTVYPNNLFPTQVPPTPVTNFNESCVLPNIALYTKMSGAYNHPLWGAFTVTPLVQTPTGKIKLQFQLGQFGVGWLCWSNYNKNQYTMRLSFANSSPIIQFGVNNPTANVLGQYVAIFNIDKTGTYQSVILPFIETLALAQANTFYRTNYNPCSSSPCMHGGIIRFTGLNCQNAPMRDCSDLYMYYKKNANGVYWIHPTNGEPMKVYCDMTSGTTGATLIQRRVDGSVNFNQPWAAYQAGFGSITGNYWMGLDKIHGFAGSAMQNYSIRVDLWDCSPTPLHAYETYTNFWISGALDNYRFHVSPGSAAGTANDGFTFGFSYFTQQNMQFTTADRDNDNAPNENCAQTYSSGWWYNDCYAANMNGVYYPGCSYTSQKRNGIEWIPWKFTQYSMKRVEIKIYRTGLFY